MTDHAPAQRVLLRAADAELAVEPQHGCRLSSLRVGGTELLRQGQQYGSFVMVPWCGRTDRGRFRNGGELHQLPVDSGAHAMHGTVYKAAWRTVRADERSAAFTCDLTDPWPWEGRVTQLVELAEDGASLTLTLGVETLSDSFPAQAGWHPWFLRNLGNGGEDVRIGFDAEWQEKRGEDYLPTGERIDPLPGPWDDCFGMPQGVDVTLTWPGELEVNVASRAEWAVVYDKQPEAVCVEPQSGPPNGLNTLPRFVTPIEPLEIATTWSWRSAPSPA
ncbi:aldose 1-epimerase [Streptomyces sp. N2-109]|uniref:Aldose 1-epimerase n=1 Tax=Streptomyces gossypii TaxID=2883101 RepID=A0ABT2JP97_9ACTN|nr:aldose 1-epimerase [Streptomyces gossypii]MCT2589712.1 aldose 1-epimerase [Streptomyces gossypii]